MDTARYEAEVEIRTATGELVVYRGDGVGPIEETGEQLLAGVEAAALAQEPGGTVEAARVRKAG
ncbi:hypothetical protein [Kitasatospora sp. A2-31]|uniref:hypothetical protein n=1 Tax=Kitasatospora sp. A2-31 TaxID=2916414 RepID=UPI001EECC449|nr:hypothetical protein [Kitasatospora sp. A2-31]MCG6496632.1 hypothetical protein [Kitasatospora sp. A2-31]